jgi:hypothetical protein
MAAEPTPDDRGRPPGERRRIGETFKRLAKVDDIASFGQHRFVTGAKIFLQADKCRRNI